MSWKVYVEHANCENSLADCSTDYDGRAATIRLNTKWRALITDDSLDESALHEVLEVMLSPLFGSAKARVWDEVEYTKNHHSVIRVFEKLLREEVKHA